MLDEVSREIELKREQFETFRKEQHEAIDALKQAWEEEKLVLQQEAYDASFAQGFEDGI